jgi:hypothetical protein
VADDLAIFLSNQRKTDVAALAQSIHELRFGGLTEGEAVNVPDSLVVSGGFGSNVNAHGFSLVVYGCCFSGTGYRPVRFAGWRPWVPFSSKMTEAKRHCLPLYG